MALEQRLALLSKIAELRGSTVIAFLTSVRPGVPAQISDDMVRVFFDHLLLLPSRPVKKLDLFLCSNGGSGTVPWRLVSLFREFAESFCVLIPYRAYSAASLLALGADEIVMHPFAELGPIDPTVSNEFNPTDQSGRHQGISVEDVTAYVHFVKTTVGIRHEDELIKAIEILAQKVHPLALGNVERFISQSRLIATKILRTHMPETDAHKMNEIVENLASKLYFHGHPINRKEAKDDINLEVTLDLQPDLETGLWDLYKEYEAELENLTPFNPPSDIAAMQAAQQPPQPGQPQIPLSKDYTISHAIIESVRISSQFITKRRYTVLPLAAYSAAGSADDSGGHSVTRLESFVASFAAKPDSTVEVIGTGC
jgi:hypothetical protein